jgi:hypothetical protein
MRAKEVGQTITGATLAVAGTAVFATSFKGDMLRRADLYVVDATLVGPTGGTLDVYLQRKLAANDWADWIHFPQVAAGTTKRYSAAVDGTGPTLVDIGGGSDASPGVALAANTVVNVMPGDEVRAVIVLGVGTSVAGSIKVTLTPYSERR